MGAAWLDVVPGGDVETVLADLREGEPTSEPTTLQAWLGGYDGGPRIELYAHDRYDRLGDLVAGVLRRTGVVRRAVVYLDHDEYGAEHVVLTRDEAGTVHRVHHVFVYPYDDESDEYVLDGEPSMTDVPAAPGAGPGTTPGALLDDTAARAMTADLFGVSAASMRSAADRAAQAHEELEIVGGPPSAWLDAFGLAWVGSAGGGALNLRPGPVWRDAVARELVPRLPGRWLARDYDLVRLPASPVMCVILPGRRGGHAVLHPLYVPDQYGILQFFTELRYAVADAVPDPLEPLLNDVTGNALPYFDRHGHPAGLRQLCQERVAAAPAGHADPHDLRCLAASEVILGDYAAAAATYATLATAISTDSAAWAQEIAEEAHVRSRLLHHDPAVVHEALTATIHQQETHLGLPRTS